jgi:hypothetical protein
MAKLRRGKRWALQTSSGGCTVLFTKLQQHLNLTMNFFVFFFREQEKDTYCKSLLMHPDQTENMGNKELGENVGMEGIIMELK